MKEPAPQGAGSFLSVPGMFDSLEAKVLYPVDGPLRNWRVVQVKAPTLSVLSDILAMMA